jgi:hypothetical protein
MEREIRKNSVESSGGVTLYHQNRPASWLIDLTYTGYDAEVLERE